MDAALKLLEKVSQLPLSYERIVYPPTYSSLQISSETNAKNIETACAILASVDGSLKQILVSAHYAINCNRLQQALNAGSFQLLHDTSIIADEVLSELLIDRNLVNETEEILLRSNCNKIYAKFNTKALISSDKCHVVDFTLLPSYKAKVSSVSPCRRREVFSNGNPYLGISLDNSNFVRSKLLASLEWIANRFSKCLVLIGDSIHRITIASKKNITYEEALNEALEMGQHFVQNEGHIFKRFSSRCAFDFVFCSEIQETPEYLAYHNHLVALYESNSAFKNSVRSFGISYHFKDNLFIANENNERLISSSSQYFLEEFAIFACLKNRDYSVMVYPGSFATLAEISEGEHPDAPDVLKDLTVVSLHIKKR